MSHHTDHDNAYADLLGGDSTQWAFGTDFEDPLAGVDLKQFQTIHIQPVTA